MELMVHTEVPYEGSCEGTLADGGKITELEGSKKVQSVTILPNFRELRTLIVDLGKEPH